ncbi:acid transporter [Anaeramoeba flamelloides]|uniref:Acid transporter n=1 Tax=Anaeramoeba flamelloides TaxID=1746091 RepID=A0AAV7YCH6_9EUKA|nr:acid transporter [Anaeramoeba flamelloides]
MLNCFKRKKQQPSNKPKTYSPLSAYVFTTNHLLGTGIIALPYDVYAGGTLLSVIFLLLVTVISIITMMYLIESESRTQALMNVLGANEGHFLQGETVEMDLLLKENSFDIHKVRRKVLKIEDSHQMGIEFEDAIQLANLSDEKEEKNIFDEEEKKEKKDIEQEEQEQEDEDEIEDEEEFEDQEIEKKSLLTNSEKLPNEINNREEYQDLIKNPQFDIIRKYEIIDMCKMFLGKKGKFLYFLMLTLFMYGTVWSYAAVFGSSIVTLFPIKAITNGDVCDIDGNFSQNCENNYIVYLFLFALIVIPISCLDLTDQKIIQIILCIFRYVALLSIIITITVAMGKKKNPYANSNSSIAPGSKLIKWSGIDLIFTAGIFTQCSHHSITIIAEPVDNKRKLRNVFSASLTSTFLFYSIVGVLCSMFFGKHTNTVITLNWMDYTDEQEYAPTWASIIKYIIIMFPIFDLISVFPLKVVTLGTGMQTLWYPNSIGKTDRRSKVIKIVFRLIGSIPPIIGAMIIKELPIILFFVGVCGCFIGFIIPAWLQLKSKSISKIVFQKEKTPYSNRTNKNSIIWTTMVFGIVALFASMICSIINLYKKYDKKT